MLRFRLEQVHVPSLGRYLLPLPKMALPSLELLVAHLQHRGYKVIPRGEKRLAEKGQQRIMIDALLGLASSSTDMLDAIGPAVPALIASRGEAGKDRVASHYLSVQRSKGFVQVQFLPRVESARTWSCLRRDGLTGLTPDEAAAVGWTLSGDASPDTVDCVTESPRDGSLPFQLGRRIYYRSKLPKAEFMESLRVMGSVPQPPVSYLPREPVLKFSRLRSPPLPSALLGEWCLL